MSINISAESLPGNPGSASPIAAEALAAAILGVAPDQLTGIMREEPVTCEGMPPVAPPAEALPPQPPVRSRRLGHALVSVTTTLAVALPAATVVALEPWSPNKLGDTKAYSFAETHPGHALPPTNRKTAPDIDTASLADTKFLLSLPENPDITTMAARVDKLANEHPEDRREVINARVDFEMRKKVADKYGLTVFDPTATLRTLYNDSTKELSKRTLSIEDYIDIANDYLSNFNMWISAEAPGKEYSYDLHAPTMDELAQQADIRGSIINMVQGISRQPREFTDQTGIQRLLLATQTPGKPDSTAGAYVLLDDSSKLFNAIVFNVSGYISEGTVFHEEGHHEDYNLSGGYAAMNQDQVFTNLAGGAPYGEKDAGTDKDIQKELLSKPLGFLTLGDYLTLRYELSKQLDPYIGLPGCVQMGFSLEQQLHAAGSRTVFETSYAGAKSVVEHKAETWSYIPSGNQYPQVLDPWLPVIREQVTVELARLGYVSPGLERYFIDTSNRPTTKATDTPYQDKCTQPHNTGPNKGGPATDYTGGK